MKKVFEQYAKHIIRIKQRAHAMKSNLTHGERKAIAYYTAAAQAVQALIEATTPVWVGLEFRAKKSAFD